MTYPYDHLLRIYKNSIIPVEMIDNAPIRLNKKDKDSLHEHNFKIQSNHTNYHKDKNPKPIEETPFNINLPEFKNFVNEELVNKYTSHNGNLNTISTH